MEATKMSPLFGAAVSSKLTEFSQLTKEHTIFVPSIRGGGEKRKNAQFISKTFPATSVPFSQLANLANGLRTHSWLFKF
jgi:hypothetical protein